METIVETSKQTKQNGRTNPANIADAAQKVELTQAQIEQKEYDAIIGADLAFSKAVVATGFNTVLRLARDFGMSVDKFGYPSLSASRRLVEALAIRNVTHKQFDAVCGTIRNAIGTNPDVKMSDEDIATAKEKAVTGKGKGKQGRSSLSLSLKAPKAWDIAAE
jgi:hypothetical protein